MTVAENLRMAELRGKRRGLRVGLDRASLERYRAALASLGMRLENRLLASMGTLSGGQRQAITLLMATISRPDLLLLDEHTAALDPRAAEQIMSVTEHPIMMHRGMIVAELSGDERR